MSPTPCAVVVYGELFDRRLARSSGASIWKLNLLTDLIIEIEVHQIDLVHDLIALLDTLLLFDITHEMAERELVPQSDRKIELSRRQITAVGLRTSDCWNWIEPRYSLVP